MRDREMEEMRGASRVQLAAYYDSASQLLYDVSDASLGAMPRIAIIGNLRHPRARDRAD